MSKRNRPQPEAKSPSPRKKREPTRDRRPRWWTDLAYRFDIIGRLAERLEERWQLWWVPLILFSFPVLLIVLALIITALR